jgi:hypothetical protein
MAEDRSARIFANALLNAEEDSETLDINLH